MPCASPLHRAQRRPLRGNDTLVSAQGRFELGLFSPAGSSGDRFYLGIWYKNITG